MTPAQAAAVDASLAILENPMVPEERRNCPNCESPVGRSRDGQPGRTEGFVEAMNAAVRAYIRFAGASRIEWAGHLATERRRFRPL